jgi:hypothetical protein
MLQDPVVDEIKRIREELAARHGYDMKAIFADLRKRQAAHGARLVSPPRKARVGRRRGAAPRTIQPRP